jgi:hypothetical protein
VKVIGLSGAQGGGKSSLLIELEKRGWRLDKFRVSRAVQAELGWEKLDNVMESWDTMVRFQEEVFRQKYNHDSALWAKKPSEFEPVPGNTITLACTKESMMWGQRNSVILTERTFADIAAYSTLWAWKHVDRGNITLSEAFGWLGPYIKGCSDAQTSIYDATLLLPYMPDVIKWEEDPNRAARGDVNAVYEDVERFLETKVPMDRPRLKITTATIEARASQVEQFLWSTF